MKRIKTTPRKNWEQIAEQCGFSFHHVNNDIYWDESVCYSFTLNEIEYYLEDPAQELAELCLDLVNDIVRNEEKLELLSIPEPFWDMILDSWLRNEPSLYGRFDFAYDGRGPAKLYEYNADTPTSLYEASFFQWKWLEDATNLGIIPSHSDQFNSIQEHLIEAFSSFGIPELLHLASMKDTEEDRATVEYLRDCAEQAGIKTSQMYIEDIAADSNGQFLDTLSRPIRWLFKLYPWEFMLRDHYAQLLPGCDTTFIEPAWKMVLSNKGILPFLWQKHKGHPNLLPAWFHNAGKDPLVSDYVLKPLYSREGANIYTFKNNEQIFFTEGDYGAEGYVGQALCTPPYVDGYAPVMGLWVVGGKACGLGIREDESPITGDLARFVPHYIE